MSENESRLFVGNLSYQTMDQDLQDYFSQAGVVVSVNVKLDKCGGIFEAHKMIAIARAHGLKVMLGCMISSSVSIAAAAHLSPLVDYADLDGFLLIANDPMASISVQRGKIMLTSRPGLGLVSL